MREDDSDSCGVSVVRRLNFFPGLRDLVDEKRLLLIKVDTCRFIEGGVARREAQGGDDTGKGEAGVGAGFKKKDDGVNEGGDECVWRGE